MKALVVKKFFLDIKDREAFEREVLEQNPELVENNVLEWDDEELVEKFNKLKKTWSK